jgi:hypothetical protein
MHDMSIVVTEKRAENAAASALFVTPCSRLSCASVSVVLRRVKAVAKSGFLL